MPDVSWPDAHRRRTACPMPADALDAAGVAYTVEGHNGQRLDFYLPAFDTFIVVKQLHSPRIAAQMASADNVIAIQGRRAAEAFAAMLAR